MVADSTSTAFDKIRAAPGPENLSDREREILRLIGALKSNKEIGVLLGLSPHTVAAHRKLIHLKLELHTTDELVLYALYHKLVKL